MRQPTRFRHNYRKILSRQQQRNRWLLYAGLGLLAVVGNRCTASCIRAKVAVRPGMWAVAGHDKARLGSARLCHN